MATTVSKLPSPQIPLIVSIHLLVPESCLFPESLWSISPACTFVLLVTSLGPMAVVLHAEDDKNHV